MSYKILLAELANKEDLPIEKFRSLSAYKELEKNEALIEKIQEFHLPEVNRLIFTSDKLINEPWAKWYRIVKDLVLDESNTNNKKMFKTIENILDICYKEKCFDFIIALEDEIVTGSFYMYFEKIKSQKNKMIDSAKEIEDVIILRNKKANDEKIDNGKKELLNKYNEKKDDELNTLYEMFKNNVTIYDSCLSRDEEYIHKIDKIRNSEIDFDTRRMQVYELAKEIIVPDAGMFIREFTKTGRITKGYVDLLKKDDFILEIYTYLDKQPQISCPVIAHLADEGGVNVDSKECKKLLNNIPNEYISSYLFDDYKDGKCVCRNRIISSLWDIAIKKEIKSDKVVFYDLWAIVSDERSWNYIINKIKGTDGINFHKNIIKFMSNDNFRSPEIIANIVATNMDVDFREKLWDICEELLDNKNKHNFLMAIHDELRRRDQRRRQIIIEQEAENRRIVQSLFGEVYQPIEKLERFVYNLKKGDITYSKKLVVSEVADSVVELRYGLSAIGLSSLEDEELWRTQTKIKYDCEKHNINSMQKNKPKEVLLKTIGFVYQNEDGDKKYHKAEAVVADKDRNTVNSKHNSTNVIERKINENRQNTSAEYNAENWYDPVVKRGSKK